MSKTLLMIAFEFPPSNGASVPRIESFYRYLKAWGWKVIVLTAKSHAYVNLNTEHTDSSDDIIYRTTALDVQRQLSFKGKYLEVMATPDRWGLTWIPSAIIKGRSLVRQYQPDVIWSSSPTPSPHFIANHLSQKFNTPWVADYRDPFHYMNGSAGKWLDKVHKKIDQTTLKNASHLTFATTGVKNVYVDKYKTLIDQKSTVIENGYDEANFEKLKLLKDTSTPLDNNKFTLYYSGVLYSNGRDPIPVFEALSELKNQNKINNDTFELVFQGAGMGEEFRQVIAELNIQDIVKFIKPVSFIKALNNMTQADALLLIQDKRFNKQIPGKVYEYLRTKRPIILKSDIAGETYKLTNKFDGVYCGNNSSELKDEIISIINRVNVNIDRDIEKFNRESKACSLQDILFELLK
jgi:glycosyltransferase involved in cell wall biosynthesis